MLRSAAAGPIPRPGEPQTAQNTASLPVRIEPKAQALLDQTLQALGGPAFLSFRTFSSRGRAFVISGGETAGLAPFQSDVEYPDKRRFSYGRGKPVILINNGDQGWELDQYGMIHQHSEQIHRWQLSMRYSLENLLRLRVHEPGTLVQSGGTDFVDNFPVRVLDIIDRNQIEVKVYIQQTTLLPIRITYRAQDPKTLEWDEYSDVYADYQRIQGIQTPKHIARFENGERVAETYRNSGQYNQTYPAGNFEPGG